MKNETYNKLLYIGRNINRVKSGGDQVNRRNLMCLQEIFGTGFSVIEPLDSKCIFLTKWGGNRQFLKSLSQMLSETNYDYVFISQSLLGNVAKFIKTNFPDIKIITFFHNIEVHYAREFIKTSGILHYPFYLSARRAEKNAVKYS